MNKNNNRILVIAAFCTSFTYLQADIIDQITVLIQLGKEQLGTLQKNSPHKPSFMLTVRSAMHQFSLPILMQNSKQYHTGHVTAHNIIAAIEWFTIARTLYATRKAIVSSDQHGEKIRQELNPFNLKNITSLGACIACFAYGPSIYHWQKKHILHQIDNHYLHALTRNFFKHTPALLTCLLANLRINAAFKK